MKGGFTDYKIDNFLMHDFVLNIFINQSENLWLNIFIIHKNHLEPNLIFENSVIN